MKKLALGMAAFLALGLASCKKDYVCECTYDDGSGTTATSTANYSGVKKKDAEDSCDSAESSANSNGITGWNCTLKEK